MAALRALRLGQEKKMNETLYEAERGAIDIALAGDAMIARRMRVFREPRFLALI